MTRIVEIIKNTLILRKQVLEQELEDVINSNNGSVDDRVAKGIEVLENITKVNETQTTLDSYINNNNTK